jgi:hypothetical protein
MSGILPDIEIVGLVSPTYFAEALISRGFPNLLEIAAPRPA